MKPSDWLERNIIPSDVYWTFHLESLAKATGIGWDPNLSLLSMGALSWHSGHARVPSMTPRETLRTAHDLGMKVSLDENQWYDGRLVFGFQITEAVWYLLRDIRLESPPSTFVRTPREKHEACLNAIRKMGY